MSIMHLTVVKVILAAVISGMGVRDLIAQSRPVGRAAAVQAAVESGREPILIRSISGPGHAGKVKTPDYSVSPTENFRQRDWVRIAVTYDTESDWIDELEFRYFAVVKHAKTGAFTLFSGTVEYIDIPKGRNHVSTMFLRPNTIERYGELERVAVEIYSRGEFVAGAGLPENPPQWWRTPMSARTMTGVLMNRAQTPFAFVGYDNYQTIKPR